MREEALRAFEDKYNQSLDLFIYKEGVYKVRVHDYGRMVEDHKFTDYDKAVICFNELKAKYEVLFNK
jgi:hypothetical protein